MEKGKIYAIIGAIISLGLSVSTMTGHIQIFFKFGGFKNELAFAYVTLFFALVLFVLGFSKEEEEFGNNVKKN